MQITLPSTLAAHRAATLRLVAVRTLAVALVFGLALFLRLLAVERLALDFDEDDYLRAGQLYAQHLAAGDLGAIVFPGRRAGLFACLVLATLPPAGLAAPFFIYLNSLGIRQTLLGLVLVYSAVAVPFAIWTIRTAVQGVGRDLEEAAALEGAGPWRVFTRVTLPLVAPSVGAAGFIAFMIAWSEYALAWALISDPELVTLAMALYGMRGLSQVSWGLLCATALLVALPVLIAFYGLGRYVLDGLTFGATRST
jgi:ABC-type glycerol-3-phosphate transport system permease component